MDIETKKRLISLKRDYEILNEECFNLERLENLTFEQEIIRSKKLQVLYREMQPIANEYNRLAAMINNKKSKVTKKKASSNTSKNRKKALLTAAILATSICLGSCAPINKNKNRNQTTIEETVSDSILNRLNKLNKDQKENWLKIAEFQNYFNNTAAPSIKIEEDGDAQLYLTAEECVALYTRFNAKELTAEEMAGIFGSKSGYFTDEKLDDNFLTACRVLNYYYFTATKTSGLDKLFINEKDAELFRETEALLLEYNKDISNTANKQKLHDKIMSIFFDGSLENAKETATGAYSAIGTAIVPILHVTNVISETELNKIVELNETVTCDILRRYVKEATEITTVTPNQEILSILPDLLDAENIKVKSRNIDFKARYLKLYDLINKGSKNKNNNPGSGNGGNNNPETDVTDEVTREEAIEEFGEDVVKEKEEEAKEKCEEKIEEKNKEQEEYKEGLEEAAKNEDLYDDIFNDIVNGNTPVIPDIDSNTGNENYDKGVEDGSNAMIDNAINDAQQAIEDRENYDNTHPVETVIVKEEELTEEEVERELARLLRK